MKDKAAVLVWSAPARADVHLLSVDGQRAVLDGAARQALVAQLAAGELSELTFEAVTFRAAYPNRNFVRFRDADLAGFTSSFAGVPFLRDHDLAHIEARGGTVRAAALAGREMVMQIALTVPRDIEAFLHGQIDRFSISWHYTAIKCSVCGQDWLGRECSHWPGRKYPVGREGKVEELCELLFEGPQGREVSAVNAPAVEGTGVRSVLSELAAWKAELRGDWGMDDEERTEQPAAEVVGVADVLAELVAQRAESAALLQAQRAAVLDSRLAAARLPAALQTVVREGLGESWTLAQLDASIERQRAAWAELEQERTVTGHGTPRDGARVTGVLDSMDRITEAMTALIEGRAPTRGVRPLSGIREAYMLLSGDYEMTGMFQPDGVGLSNVTSSTMANIVANVMNKIVVNEFQRYPRWWLPLVRTENFTTLQTVKWITLGGVGELPTVSEGAAYTELSWDDQAESSAWVKKGGYLGITLEAIDKDDVGRLRNAPRALAQAAWLTLGKSISAIFTANTGAGPTMSDGVALFHNNHANLGATALGTSSWAAAKLAMRKQTELNSGERLGGLTAPKYLLVPPDLENTALTVLASENLPGTANNDINPEAIGDSHEARMAAARRRIVIVDLWTDTNNWAAIADPLMYPSIGLGYRFGETPEIFSVATPNSGLMFISDVMPIKVRYFFAVGPTDYRGLYKANVA